MKKLILLSFITTALISYTAQASQLKIQGAIPFNWKIKQISASYGADQEYCSHSGDKNKDVLGDVKLKNGIYSAKIKYKEFKTVRYALFFTCRQYLDYIQLDFSSLDQNNVEIRHSMKFKPTYNVELVNVPLNSDQNVDCKNENYFCLPVGINPPMIYILRDNNLDLKGWNILQ
jgi:hypothetical protein